MHAMQGTYAPALIEQGLVLSTDDAGRFSVKAPTLARYTFNSTSVGVCVDAVSGGEVAFPFAITLPPLANATITAISLLTVPARSDLVLQAKYGSMSEVVPQELWAEVYGMFGYPAADAAKVRKGCRLLGLEQHIDQAALLADCFMPCDTTETETLPPLLSTLPYTPRLTTSPSQESLRHSLQLCWATVHKPCRPSPPCTAC